MSMPAPRYDAWQTAFYWSWLSNDASQHDVLVPLDHSQKWPQCLEKAREQATRIFTERLTDKVRQALQQGQELIGDDWQAVWGPVAYVKAGLFELENGLWTHLDSAQISGILNPDHSGHRVCLERRHLQRPRLADPGTHASGPERHTDCLGRSGAVSAYPRLHRTGAGHLTGAGAEPEVMGWGRHGSPLRPGGALTHSASQAPAPHRAPGVSAI